MFDVAAQGVDEVVAADGQGVAVAGDDPDVEVGPGHGQAGGQGRGPAVDGVDAVGVHVVGEAGGAADAGDEDHVLPRDAELGHEHLDGGEDGVVAAAGAPADLLVGGPVLRRGARSEVVGHAGHLLLGRVDVRAGRRRASSRTASSISAARKGALDLGEELGVDQVLGPQRAATSWPRLTSGTSTFVGGQDVAEVGGERVEVDEVDVGHARGRGPGPGCTAGGDGPVGGAPAEDEHAAPPCRRVVDLERAGCRWRCRRPWRRAGGPCARGSPGRRRRCRCRPPSRGRRCGARGRGCRGRPRAGPGVSSRM